MDVINVLITMYDSKGNGQVSIAMPLPSESEFKEILGSSRKIINEDPAKYYDILGKLGQGGFAKVFKVKRKSDGLICALKYMEPKNEKEYKMLINEIGLMQVCTDAKNDLMLKVFEAYEFENHLWVFVELMDDALTGFVQNLF